MSLTNMMGRPPLPTEVKALRGNPGKRPLNNDPHVPAGIPDCPDWLTDVAKAEWVRILPILLGMQILTIADLPTVAGYCQSYARWRQAEELIDEIGMVVREPILNDAGAIVGYKIKRNPACIDARGAKADMDRFLSKLGFSPSDRTRIHAESPQENDDAERFFALPDKTFN